MKILYVSKADIPSSTANSLNIMASCSAMTQLGHKVVLCAPKPKHLPLSDPFAFYGLPQSFRLQYLSSPDLPGGRTVYTFQLRRCACSWNPDLVYGRYPRGLLALSRKGWPTIMEMHTIIRNGDHRKLKELQKMIRSSGFIGLVTLTRTMANHFQLLEPSHLTEQQIWVAHCGGDPQTNIEPTPLPRHTSGWQIAYAGTLSERKGLALVEHIANVLPHHDFHIFGGNKEDTEYWRQRIPWPHVHFHGFIAPGQLAKRLAAVELCLLPNQQVPWNKTGEIISSPLKLFDYMALGKTILASDFPEIREVVSNEEAVLLPFDEPSQWIDAIEGLGQNQAKALGRRARELFHSHYTRQKRYEKLLRSIAHCLAS